MNPLEALGNDSSHTQQRGSFGGPVARAAGAVLLPGDDDQRRALSLVSHRRVIDGNRLIGSAFSSVHFADPTFGSRHHQVFDPDVGKGAARHYAVVAATGTVTVEVLKG